MRPLVSIFAFVTLGLAVAAQDKKANEIIPSRFDVISDIEIYPQAEPKLALASVVKAVEKGRYDYVLAHLMDPRYIDRRMEEGQESFAELVAAMRTKIRENPELVKGLKLLLKEGETQEANDTITFTHKDLKDRKATLVKIGQRWFLLNERNYKK